MEEEPLPAGWSVVEYSRGRPNEYYYFNRLTRKEVRVLQRPTEPPPEGLNLGKLVVEDWDLSLTGAGVSAAPPPCPVEFRTRGRGLVEPNLVGREHAARIERR